MAELPDDKSGMREIASMAGLPLTLPFSLKNDHPWPLTEGAVAEGADHTAVSFTAFQVWSEVSLHVRCLWTRSARPGHGERAGAGVPELHQGRSVLPAGWAQLRDHRRVPPAAGAGSWCCGWAARLGCQGSLSTWIEQLILLKADLLQSLTLLNLLGLEKWALCISASFCSGLVQLLGGSAQSPCAYSWAGQGSQHNFVFISQTQSLSCSDGFTSGGQSGAQ